MARGSVKSAQTAQSAIAVSWAVSHVLPIITLNALLVKTLKILIYLTESVFVEAGWNH